MLKRLKIIYSLYNFFHKKQLSHNIPKYKKLGLRKKYYSSISSKDFEACVSEAFALQDVPVETKDTNLYKEASKETQCNIENFEKDGYLIIKNFYTESKVDAINEAIGTMLAKKEIKFTNSNKIMFAIHQSKLLKDIGNEPDLIQFLSSLMKGKATLFQSINFLHGSEQDTHSDSIHMTTFPLGGLLGLWIALEDINLTNGPLHYFPGSHHFPYFLNSDYNNEGSSLLLGDKDYTQYEKMIDTKIDEHKIQKHVLIANKGDLLIWHANLLHGGQPHLDKEKTRKSMVLHYYNEDCICYHEITQRPALLQKY